MKEPEIWGAINGWSRERYPNKTVLRHGDFWPGNLLWRDGEIVAVIDWEESSLGEPLIDLSISRLDILWVLGWEAMEQFTQSYISQRNVDITALPYWDLDAALRPQMQLAEWAASYPPLGRADITETTMSRDLLQFVEQALRKS